MISGGYFEVDFFFKKTFPSYLRCFWIASEALKVRLHRLALCGLLESAESFYLTGGESTQTQASHVLNHFPPMLPVNNM